MGMCWWRHSRLAQTVALVLLLWTAADLSNASLCALDNERTAPLAGSTGATLQDGSTRQIPARPFQHIDDCFCCSHCVDVQAFSPVAVSMPLDTPHPVSVLAAPRIFGSPLYHPPLA